MFDYSLNTRQNGSIWVNDYKIRKQIMMSKKKFLTNEFKQSFHNTYWTVLRSRQPPRLPDPMDHFHRKTCGKIEIACYGTCESTWFN